MDNISHSAAGFLAGEIIHRSLPEESHADRTRVRRSLLLTSSVAASNFPDLDLVLTPLLPPPLGYLLHHRGHTHTLLYSPPQALLLILIILALWPSARRLLKESSVARKGFGLTLLVGFSLHMLMDYLNSYGIHPFHPFNSNWLFGDMVFIVEPVFWVIFGIPMVMTVKRKWLKRLLLSFLIALPILFTALGFLPWFSLLALAVGGTLVGWLESRAGQRSLRPLIASAMIGLSFVAIQSYASGIALRTTKEALAKLDPQSQFLEAAMTSYPTNPVCWGFISIEMNEASGTYRLRRGLLSLAPQMMPPQACPRLLSESQDQTLVSDSVSLLGEETGSLQLLRELVAKNCHFEAWMRFARAPVLKESSASDMRFDRGGPRGNFTLLEFDKFKNRECSPFVPEWGTPRRDLLHEDTGH